jgi:hypothetical protein
VGGDEPDLVDVATRASSGLASSSPISAIEEPIPSVRRRATDAASRQTPAAGAS